MKVAAATVRQRSLCGWSTCQVSGRLFSSARQLRTLTNRCVVEKRATAIAALRARLDEGGRPALKDVCRQLEVSQRGTLEQLHDRCARKVRSHFATFDMPSPDDSRSTARAMAVHRRSRRSAHLGGQIGAVCASGNRHKRTASAGRRQCNGNASGATNYAPTPSKPSSPNSLVHRQLLGYCLGRFGNIHFLAKIDLARLPVP